MSPSVVQNQYIRKGRKLDKIRQNMTQYYDEFTSFVICLFLFNKKSTIKLIYFHNPLRKDDIDWIQIYKNKLTFYHLPKRLVF